MEIPNLLEDERSLPSEDDEIRDSGSSRNEYTRSEAQDLSQAIEVIVALRRQVAADNNRMAWNKLLHATEHLEKLLRSHVESDKE